MWFKWINIYPKWSIYCLPTYYIHARLTNKIWFDVMQRILDVIDILGYLTIHDARLNMKRNIYDGMLIYTKCIQEINVMHIF